MMWLNYGYDWESHIHLNPVYYSENFLREKKNDFGEFYLSVTNRPLVPVDDFSPRRGWKFDFQVASFLSAKLAKKLCNIMQSLFTMLEKIEGW